MGIHGLTKVIADNAPNSRKEYDIKDLFGRKVAIDASMFIYQFLIAVRQQDGMQLANELGETTSHLVGIFYRTIRMCDNGLKPVYVFDGKPPEMKSGELKKRTLRRDDAQAKLNEALEQGDKAEADRFSRRLVKVTPQHNSDCQKLLSLMGIPYVIAPSEAEAQCAIMAKAGLVYGAGSEDMDTLSFGSPVLLRHLNFSESRKMPIVEFSLPKVLEGLNFTMDQFVDLCILLGCDYLEGIKGLGPQGALRLMREHGSIESILEEIKDMPKYTIPSDWDYVRAREMFKEPEATPGSEISLQWKEPDIEGCVKFLCEEKGFNEDRIRSSLKKLEKASKASVQVRIDSFFKVTPKDPSKLKNGKPGSKVLNKVKGSNTNKKAAGKFRR